MFDLTHFNQGGQAYMIDVGDKSVTKRIAIAGGQINMLESTLALIKQGDNKKGDVLGVARVAGIMAAKKTSDLIPLCHPLALTTVTLDFQILENDVAVQCYSQVETRGQTGVEMEALTAAQIALLTIYDMCKAVDRSMIITDIRLLEKAGGQSGHWSR